MGLGTFLSNLTSPRVKEISPHQSYSNLERSSGLPHTRSSPNVPHSRSHNHEAYATNNGASRQPLTALPETTEQRSSRPGIAKQKSESNLKKRRSWFGGKRKVDEEIPAVPQLHNPAAETQPARPGTAVTTDEPISWSRSQTPEDFDRKTERRRSFFGRKRSQSTTSNKSKRRSWFGGRADEEEAPPLPPMPIQHSSEQHHTASAPQQDREKRRTESYSLGRQKRASVASTRSKKRSSWILPQSSNPDSEDERDEPYPPLPPLPALIADDNTSFTPDSSVATTQSPVYSNFMDTSTYVLESPSPFYTEDPVKQVTRGNSIKSPRPISGVSLSSRRSYVPRNAEKGFLKSTNQNRRSNIRHSLLDDGEGGVMMLSDEQQREWDKLKHLLEVMEQRQDQEADRASDYTESEADGRSAWERRHDPHSNSDALTALEFGVAR